MKYELSHIISRIEWCRLQQQLPSVTREERAGWRAEEAGLVDALGTEIGAPSCEKNTNLTLLAINAVSRMGKPSSASALGA